MAPSRIERASSPCISTDSSPPTAKEPSLPEGWLERPPISIEDVVRGRISICPTLQPTRPASRSRRDALELGRLTTEEFPAVVPRRLLSEEPPRYKVPAPRSPSPSVEEDGESERKTDPGRILQFVSERAEAPRERAILTVLTGVNAGQVFALDRTETTIGRSREADVWIDDVGISRRHTRIVHGPDGKFMVEDLGSTNGTFVAARRVDRLTLRPGDRIQVGPNVLFRFSIIDETEEQLARALYEASTRDALTRVFNRKYLVERLLSEVAYAVRHHTAVAVVLFDLDRFKAVNDTLGHLAGDVVLRVVAATVQKTIRVEDVLARYGGEEFAIIVRGIEHDKVNIFAERIRLAVEALEIEFEATKIRPTVSIGVASLWQCRNAGADAHARVEALFALADERVYRAKELGRNRVCA